MIGPLLTIIIILISLVVYLLIDNNGMKKDIAHMKPIAMGISPETKVSDMTLVFDSMERAVIRSLLYYVFKDFNFSEKSKVKHFYSGHYRDLISCLLNPGVLLTDTIDGEEITRQFMSVFVQRVYLLYIAETPESIKSLFFKYYSGYNIEDYNKEKRPKPSVMTFIVEYVNYYLLSRYEENKIAEAKLLDMVKSINSKPGETTSAKYKELIDQYDEKCITNLNSHIYSIYGTGVSVPVTKEEQSKTNTNKSQKKEVTNNEFAVNFHE